MNLFIIEIFMLLCFAYFYMGINVLYDGYSNRQGWMYSLLCMIFSLSSVLSMLITILDMDSHLISRIIYMKEMLFCAVPVIMLIFYTGLLNYRKNTLHSIYFVTILLFLIDVVFISMNPIANMEIKSNGLIFTNYSFGSNDISFYVQPVYYFLLFSCIIFVLFYWNNSVRYKREVKAAALVVSTNSIYFVIIFFAQVIFSRIFGYYYVNTDVILGIIPIYCIYRAIRKYNFFGIHVYSSIYEGIFRAKEGILLLNNNCIVMCNNGFCEMMGIDKKKRAALLKGKDIIDILPEELSEGCMYKDKYLEVPKLGDSTELIPVYCSRNVISSNIMGNTQSVLVLQDVTEIKQAREEVMHIHKNLKSLVWEHTKKLEETNENLRKERENRRLKEENYTEISTKDGLTGLYNRDYFTKEVGKIIDESNESSFGRRHGVIYLDLDNFKTVNETLGHSAGDEILKIVAERLIHIVPTNSMVARIGGDEFLIFLKDVPDDIYIVNVLKDLQVNLKNEMEVFGNPYKTTVSIGLSIFPDHATDIETLIKNADAAMYIAKEIKDCYREFKPDYENSARSELNLNNEMVTAFEDDDFQLFYHPQVLVREDGEPEIVGFEALIRWFHPKKGLIMPNDFIHVAEKTGFITKIDEWVINEACNQIVEWSKLGDKNFSLAVNFSNPQFEDDYLYTTVTNAIEKTGVDPKRLQVELPESFLVKNIDHSVVLLENLHDIGVKIVVDDFGTAVSSLNYLKILQIDVIKIDIDFIRGIGKNRKDEAIIIALIELSKNTDMDIVAEGVETKEQLEFLTKNGCNRIQGFYFYKPMPVQEANKFWR